MGHMATINIALLGFGTVGKGVYYTIQKHQNRFEALLGKQVKIVAVLVKQPEKHSLPDEDVLLTTDFDEIIRLPQLDIVIDAITGRQPAYTYLEQSIKRGCHIITANKEMFAYHGEDLKKFADDYQVSIGFEATVAGGIPVIQTLNTLLNINGVTKVEGILNGTSNYILSKMREEQLSFTDALTAAQHLGYAELDPRNDIEGIDAFYKAMILSQVVFGEQPNWDDVNRKGIIDITLEDIKLFTELGLRFKHIASLQKNIDGITCTVKPVLVPDTHPLYQVEGVQNAISIHADIVGNLCIQGPGAGMYPTASAMVEDIIQVAFPKEYNTVLAASKTEAPRETAEKGNWVIVSNRTDDLALPHAINQLGNLSSNLQLVSGTEIEISSLVKSQCNIQCYEILGDCREIEMLVANKK